MVLRSTDLLQANFAAGEIDPEMRHRSDVGAYDAGVETMINFVPRLHGGIRTKPGTLFHQELTGDGKLFPFVFSEVQAYIIAASNNRFDIYFNDGTVAQSNITTTFTTARIATLNMVQAADVAFFCHEEVPTKTLVRTGVNSFSFSDYGFDGTATGGQLVKHCPFYRFAAIGITIAVGNATSGTSHTVTASSSVFSSAHVGLRIRHKFKQMLITGYSSGTQVTVTNQEALDDTDTTDQWDEEAFSTVRGYPRAVAFHDQRLCFGGTVSKKSGLWLSKVGEFFNFDVDDGEDNDAIWSGISDDRVQEVRHLLSHGHLQIFCDDTEAFVPESATSPIAPDNFAIRSQTRYGILAEVPPVILDEGTIYAQRYGTGIREYMFTDLTQRYNSDLVSVLDSRAIINPKSMAVIPSSPDRPELYAYIVMGDGSMAVLHSLRAEKIVAWTRWNTPNGNYKAVVAINGTIWLIVERTINSATKYYLEQLTYDTVLESAKKLSGTNVTFTGMSHLEAESVHAVQNNILPIGTGTVGSGSVTFSESAVAPHIGIYQNAVITTLPIEAKQNPEQTSIRRKRIAQAVIGVKDGVALSAGSAGELLIHNVTDDFSLEPTAKTQRLRVFPTGYSDDAQLTVTSSVPVPITILSLAYRMAF